MNVNIRINLDVYQGAVHVYLSPKEDTFVIRQDANTWTHLVSSLFIDLDIFLWHNQSVIDINCVFRFISTENMLSLVTSTVGTRKALFIRMRVTVVVSR